MKKSVIYSAVTTATVISIAACSSGGGDVAGIGGSGVLPTGGSVSSGTITGFGSIFVNGVEFETSSSSISVDDYPGSESDLAIGMRVTVNGEINADGVTGTATSVDFDDQLQGPVASVSAVDADGLTRTVTILGTTVLLDSTTTSFDISGTVAGTFSFNNITVGDHVEVSGFFDSNGVLIATRVELEQQNFVANSSVIELKGTITGLNGTLFTVNGINIDASAAALDDLPAGLADGIPVEVKGTCADAGCDPVNATRVEGQSADFDDNDDVEIEGIITRYISDSDFDVNGFPVSVSTSTSREPTTLVLGIDKQVEVEGTVVNGVLIASKVKDEGGDVKIAASVSGIDAQAGSFELAPVAGQTSITVKIDTSTEIEDDIDDINSAALLDALSIGDFVVVEGYDDGTGTVVASEVDRESEADDIIVQGIMQSFNQDQDVTILGVTFMIQDPETEFEQDNDATDDSITQSEFIAGTTPNQSLIKIKDKNDLPSDPANGVADEIEIEN